MSVNFAEECLKTFVGYYPRFFEDNAIDENRTLLIPATYDFTGNCFGALFRNNKNGKYRDKISSRALMKSFYDSKIGGVLIGSPMKKKFLDKCNDKELIKSFKGIEELCDFIFIHRSGFYIFEVKSTDQIFAMTREERRIGRIDKRSHYEKAVRQLSDIIDDSNDGQKQSRFKQLYMAITGCRLADVPAIKGVICFPQVEKINDELNGRISEKFDHMTKCDMELSVGDGITNSQFWQKLVAALREEETANLFEYDHVRRFVAVMASCIAAANNICGIRNAQQISNRIIYQTYDDNSKSMETRKIFINTTADSEKSTFYLTQLQSDILANQSKRKMIYGAPGTGKTLLLTIDAIDRAEQCKASNTPIVFITRKSLVRYMQNIFQQNNVGHLIEVCDWKDPQRLARGTHIFADEVGATPAKWHYYMQQLAANDENRLFAAISCNLQPTQLFDIDRRLQQYAQEEGVPTFDHFCLNEVIRCTNSIADFWMNELKSCKQVMALSRKQIHERGYWHSIRLMLNENSLWTNDTNAAVRSTDDDNDKVLLFGHCIIGRDVTQTNCSTEKQIVEKLLTKLRSVLPRTPAKNVAIVVDSTATLYIVATELKRADIAHGTACEQDESSTDLVALDTFDNVLSREWPFVMCVKIGMSPINETREFRVLSASRAIADLSLFQLNTEELKHNIWLIALVIIVICVLAVISINAIYSYFRLDTVAEHFRTDELTNQSAFIIFFCFYIYHISFIVRNYARLRTLFTNPATIRHLDVHILLASIYIFFVFLYGMFAEQPTPIYYYIHVVLRIIFLMHTLVILVKMFTHVEDRFADCGRRLLLHINIFLYLVLCQSDFNFISISSELLSFTIGQLAIYFVYRLFLLLSYCFAVYCFEFGGLVNVTRSRSMGML